MIKVMYATHNLPGFTEGQVVVFDLTDERSRGLAESGYFAEIKEPDRGEAGREDRAR